MKRSLRPEIIPGHDALKDLLWKVSPMFNICSQSQIQESKNFIGKTFYEYPSKAIKLFLVFFTVKTNLPSKRKRTLELLVNFGPVMIIYASGVQIILCIVNSFFLYLRSYSNRFYYIYYIIILLYTYNIT